MEIDFDDLKVPRLGDKAHIDAGSEVDAHKFATQYRIKKSKEMKRE